MRYAFPSQPGLLTIPIEKIRRGIHCQPPNGEGTFLAHKPKAGARLAVLLQVRGG